MKDINSSKKKLSDGQLDELLRLLEARFEKNMKRHKGVKWPEVETRLKTDPEKVWSINEMEKSGGEPDVVVLDKKNREFTFIDCSVESPKERRSVCYDSAALESRKEHKPKHSALGIAETMGIEILTEEQYRELQKFGPFDMKTSSWLLTPFAIRKLGGAIFGDFRYGNVFVYHNGAESYYAARGFRGIVRI